MTYDHHITGLITCHALCSACMCCVEQLYTTLFSQHVSQSESGHKGVCVNVNVCVCVGAQACVIVMYAAM